MKLTHLATNLVIITRMTSVSGYKQAFSTVTAAMMAVQPLSLEKTALIGGVFGQTFKIYVDGDIDIQEGDRLRDFDTDEIYRVKSGAVTRRTYGSIDYREVIVEKVS